MRESLPSGELRPKESTNILRTIGMPITFAANAVLTMANPPEVHAEDSPDRPAVVTGEHSGTPRDHAGERVNEQFEAIALEMETNIRLMDDPQYLVREKAQMKLMGSARQLFRSMNPLPMHTEARWRKMMDFRSPSYTLEQRVRLKNIQSALEYEGLFRETRIPLEPDSTMSDVLKTLEKQTGIKLQFPPTWKNFEKIFNRLRGKNAVPFATFLLESCREGNCIPVLGADGVTITFKENTTKARIFLHDNMLCVLEPVDDMPDVGERLQIFPDPQESIASLEYAVSIREPKTLVEISPAGLRQWSDPESKIAPRKMKQKADLGCFDTGTFTDTDRLVDIRCAVMRNQRIWEAPLDGTRRECGIQSVYATCEKGSRTISLVWRSTDPYDSPEVCWSEMPVTANQYEALDRDGHPLQTTASPIAYDSARHSFSIQLECEKPPYRLRIRGHRSITPYDDHGEHIVIILPPSDRAVPIPPLPAPSIPPEPQP